MKNISRTIWTIIVIISYIVLIWLSIFNPKVDNKFIEKVTYIFPLTCTFIIYAYNNWNWVFVHVQRTWASLSGETVSWSVSYRKYFDINFSFSEFCSDFYDSLKDKLDLTSFNEKDDELIISYEKNGLPITVKISCVSQEDSYLFQVRFDSSTSYKESKKARKYFFDFIELVDVNSPKLFDKAKNENINLTNSFFSATIRLVKYNPFYKYILKHIQTDSQEMFSINLKENNMKIKISPHKLVVQNASKDELEGVLSNYVPISRIG